MNQIYGASGQWKKIINDHLNADALADLSDFKSSSVNYRLALNDARTNGVRYLKTLIYNLASRLSGESWRKLRKIRGRERGAPISVTFDGEPVDLDYLRAVGEVEFIAEHMELEGRRIMEIGAGYGRTCHALLSLHDVSEYWIIDLPETLRLSRAYLADVLDEDTLTRVEFVAVDDMDKVIDDSERFDLCINIDSFAEMNIETVRAYLALIDAHCRNFYTQNPVAKFIDKSLDGHSWGQEAVALALQAGPLTEVIDIHDSRAVEAQVPRFIDAYRPGPRWGCVADGWSPPFSHHWQAFYAGSHRSPGAPGSANGRRAE